MNIFKKDKKEEVEKTPIMFDGYKTDMYHENCGSNDKLVIALIDYLGDDFADLLLTKYNYKPAKELVSAINDRKSRNQIK
jgi:hypothetical protein